MKRLFSAMLAILLLLPLFSLAETPDLASMPFDDLLTLKRAVDMEYNSRPEASGISLDEGEYLVGRDIKPGIYYIGQIKPLNTNSGYYVSSVFVYADQETLDAEEEFFTALASSSLYLGLDRPAQQIELKEDNILVVHGSAFLSPVKFDPSDYYTYAAPDGVVIPNGTYVVGTDIPAGTYTVYPGSIHGGEYKYYSVTTDENGETVKTSKSGWNTPSTVLVIDPPDSDIIELEDTDILEVTKSIIFAKPAKLDFDW